MTFISVLLLAIATTVIQIGNIYNKGLTLKDVNQAGRSISYELQKSIAQTLPFSVVNPGSKYIISVWGGRLCTGQYSYIWNYGSAIPGNANRNKYVTSTNEIRFVKVIDTSSNYCTNTSLAIDFTKSVELLSAGEHNLAMHSFSIISNDAVSDPKTGQRLYNIKFTIGTNNQAALTTGSMENTACLPPSNANSDPNYCSVSKFNISVLAGGSVK